MLGLYLHSLLPTVNIRYSTLRIDGSKTLHMANHLDKNMVVDLVPRHFTVSGRRY